MRTLILVVFRSQDSSNDRRHSHHREVVSRNDLTLYFLVAFSRVEACGRILMHGEITERSAAIAKIRVVRIRKRVEAAVAIFVRRIDTHDPIGVLSGKGTQEERVHETEHGRVCTDTDGKGQDRGRGESRLSRQQAQRISEILNESTHNFLLLPIPTLEDAGWLSPPS